MLNEDKSHFASFDDIIGTETTEDDQPGSKLESFAATAEGFQVFSKCGARWKEPRFWVKRLSRQGGSTLPRL